MYNRLRNTREFEDMINVKLTNEILKRITAIEENRFRMNTIKIPPALHNRLRKNSKKKSSYASNKIEGNPLTEEQASDAIEMDPHRHFLSPEQEIRNYFLALNFLEEKAREKMPFSKEIVLQVQALVERGASMEKIGIRGPMPPGVLFAVYDADTGMPEYIPPECSEIPGLLDELETYVNTTDDHPLIVAAVVHYQLVTIHPFEDGNGRTARLMSGYIMDLTGYDFGGIGSLEEYFAYNPGEYYESLQMNLPPLYYDGRNDPPHPEIWVNYFLRMVELYSDKVCSVSRGIEDDSIHAALSYLNRGERELLDAILRNNFDEFTPIQMSKILGVTNKTVINRCAGLAENGFVQPVLIKERIRSYKVSDFTKANAQKLKTHLKKR